MPEKLTLAVYLERRGSVKALTRIEAEVFGVPYPLVKGWAHRHGAEEITQAMLEQLQEKISRAKSSTAEKAQRGLHGVQGMAPAAADMPSTTSPTPPRKDAPTQPLSPFAGFILRQARRYQQRKLSPWP